MSLSEAIRATLRAFPIPLLNVDLESAGVLAAIDVQGQKVHLKIVLGFPAAGYREELVGTLQNLLRQLHGVETTVDLSWRIDTHAVQKTLNPLPGIKNIIAIASGKGGVGKSTVAVNFALGLQAEGARVGILDADIYGPSQPRMLGTRAKPASQDGKIMSPVMAHGLQAMSIGFLVEEEQAMIWRGAMVVQAFNQLLTETRWQNLDYLVIDLPPGTGDIQLSLSQRVPVSGAVIVTTPQDIALLDARRGLAMFQKVEVSVLGVVENMSTHVCTHCGHEEHIFGQGGGEKLAAQYGVNLLGSLPLDIRIREQADGGTPTVAADPESELSLRYREIARNAAARLAYARPVAFPAISIVDD